MGSAQILGKIDPVEAGFTTEKLSNFCSSNYLGEVDPITLDPTFLCYKRLQAFAEDNGYKLSQVRLYNSSSILPLCGSVGMHDDEGMGLLMSWIVHYEELSESFNSYDYMQLVYPGGALDLKLGDVFVFNADKPHAWISNSRCVLIQLAVKKSRARKKS